MDPSLILFFVLLFVVWWFLIIQPSVREKQEQKQMLESLKKGDKVITIGGLYGTVTVVHDHDIVVRVDEKTGTKIRMMRSAVHKRIAGDPSDADDPPKDSDSKGDGGSKGGKKKK